MCAHASIKPQVEIKFNLRLVEIDNKSTEHTYMNKIGKTITTRLKELQATRTDFKRTQTWLAEELDVSNNAVSKWIKDGKIARKHVPGLAKALEISVDQLLADAAPPSAVRAEPERTTLERLNADERALIEEYRSRTTLGQSFIWKAVKTAERVPGLSQSVGSPSQQH